MSTEQYPNARLAVVGGVALALVATHVAVRFLHSLLFGFVTYQGLHPVSPWVVLSGYVCCLTAGALRAASGGRVADLCVGIGTLLFAVEPLVSGFVAADGCKVGNGAGPLATPAVTVEGVRVVVTTWGGSCFVTLNAALLAVALAFVAGGLRFGATPGSDVGLGRLR